MDKKQWSQSVGMRRRSKLTLSSPRFVSPSGCAMRTTPLTPQHIETYSRISISGHRKSSSLGKWGLNEDREEVRALKSIPVHERVTGRLRGCVSQFSGSGSHCRDLI